MNPVADTAPSNVFAVAVEWLQAVLLGSVASAVAVIAVASVGLLLLSGRIDMRRAAQAIFGCFILFGASSIATGIMDGVNRTDATAEIAPSPPPAVYPTAPVRPAQPASPYDPYAGAAMPTR